MISFNKFRACHTPLSTETLMTLDNKDYCGLYVVPNCEPANDASNEWPEYCGKDNDSQVFATLNDESPPCSPASSGVYFALASPSRSSDDESMLASPTSSIDSGAEDNDNDDDNDDDQQISSLVEVQGICHINLLNAQFIITHNEQTNDFFLDLVRASGCGDSVLQAIFRFPEQRNGTLEIFTASYGVWSRPGRLVYHDDSSPCTSAARFGSCRTIDPMSTTMATPTSCYYSPQYWPHEAVECCEETLCLENEFDSSPSITQSRRDTLTQSLCHCDKRQHWHLQLHVYEKYYTVELNGQEIERFNYRLAFEKISVI